MRPLRATVSPDDLDIRLGRPLSEFIPPGEYEAIGVGWRKLHVFKTDKLIVEFDVLVPDPRVEFGRRRVRLGRFHNIRTGPEGRESRVLAPPSGSYVREWALAAGRRPTRYDRIGPKVFIGTSFLVEVDTVKHTIMNRKKVPLPEPLYYSKVARLIERLAGGAPL